MIQFDIWFYPIYYKFFDNILREEVAAYDDADCYNREFHDRNS